MCQNSRIITSVQNGELSVCNSCGLYTLTFNNLLFQFDKPQLLRFREYIANIDIEYWLNYHSCTTKRRKIPITTLHQNLVLIFNIHEIESLRTLLGLNDIENEMYLNSCDVDYTFILN